MTALFNNRSREWRHHDNEQLKKIAGKYRDSLEDTYQDYSDKTAALEAVLLELGRRDLPTKGFFPLLGNRYRSRLFEAD